MSKSIITSRWVWSKKFAHSELYVEIATWKRLYAVPFLVLYILWTIGWLKLRSMEHAPSWLIYKEFYLIPLFLLASSQFVMFMCRFWSVTADAWLSYRTVKSVKDAEKILIVPVENYGKAGMCKIVRKGDSVFFYFQQRKFVYDDNKNVFVKLNYPESQQLSSYASSKGLSVLEVSAKMEYYDMNEFKIPVPTFVELWKEHAVAPFFVFQVFCVGLWLLDDYWYYSLFTLVMLCIFESTVVYQRLRNIKDFQTMSIPVMELLVKRGEQWTKLKSNELVPGDICAISFDAQKDLTAPCDLLLLSGHCIVNEAMLSGESTPMLKESINELGDQDCQLSLKTDHRNYVLFGGTKIMQLTPSDSAARYSPRIFYCLQLTFSISG